ncbi:hypothetical protein BGZ75_007808 [Mortierella antarctica]|nr:hypothetical protein BGZ75_007808 [Mortierella antarctica]
MKGPDDMTMVTAAATSTPTCSRFRGKARANFQDVSGFSAPPRQLNAATRFDDGQGQHLRRIAQPPLQAGTGASPSFFNSSQLAYISGKIALILLSTICLIGVIMFGALLFVVAIKVRLFRTRRSNNLYSHSARQSRNGHHHQHQPIGRNVNSSNSNRKVVPQHVLERFKVQTVLQTSPMSVALSAAVTHRRSRTKREKRPWRPVCTEYPLSLGVSESFRTRNHGRSEAQEPLDQQAQERRPSLEGSDRLPAAVALGGESEKGNGEDFSDEDDVRSESDVEANSGDEETESVREHSDDTGQSASATVTSGGISRRMTFDRQGQPNALPSISDASSGSNDSSSNSPDSVRLSDTPRGTAERHGHRRRSQRRRPRVKQGPLELPFANANAQTACSICLTEYEVGEQVRTLPCFHQYHQGCIDPWLLHVVSLCPMCKRDLYPAPTVDESIAAPLSLTAEPFP